MNTEAFCEGYRAYQDGMSIDTNPYSSMDPEWDMWKEGWYAAAEDD